MNSKYTKILDYLQKYGGEQYKKIDKCKNIEEKQYMEEAADAGKEARQLFTDIAEEIAKATHFGLGRITQWQNSGTFVSYFWTQLKKSEFIDSNISLSLFAEKVEDVFRFRISIELMDDKSTKEECERFAKLQDIPLESGLVYVAGGNNKGKFEVLSERDNNIVKAQKHQKIQVSYIVSDAESDEEFISLIKDYSLVLVKYYEYVMDDNEKKKLEAFLKYIGPENDLSGYVKSYKLIFYKSFFELCSIGSVKKSELAEKFQSFYASRIEHGLQPDYEVTSTIANADKSTTENILKVIMDHPYAAIRKTGFFTCDDDNFIINSELFSELSKENIADILNLVNKKIDYYYSQYEHKKDIQKSKVKEGEEQLSTKDIVEQIKNYIASKGFSYEGNLIENFYLSLKSKPFVILAGTSGTGKTKLVKLFAEAIGAKYMLVSVRPDWSDSTDLFGHTNLKGEFVSTEIINFIKAAKEHLDYPYFLCLDEMNLARVEYYLSDFLSLIETRKNENGEIVTNPIQLDKAASDFKGLYLPENLYIIGTVNMDETTFPFSKKVLDRANTIEFSYVDLLPQFDFDEAKGHPVPQSNDFLKTKYITLKTDISSTQQNSVVKICQDLQKINEILKEANAHVGYRVRDEIVFYMLNNEEADLIDYKDALDNEIMQKILPRIQGSSIAVKDLLCKLFKKFAGDYTGLSQNLIWEQMDKYIESKPCTYKKSAEKICYMMRRYEEDGFTSYWL